jgi:HEAT repeat protein
MTLMTGTSPPDPGSLVAALERSETRFPAYQALIAIGAAALPAIRVGLRHADWQVRKWSAMVLDQVADADALVDLVPLMRDPKSDVRLWAVHSVACDHCKDDVTCPVDLVPMLIERIQSDDNIRVRRMATIMLATEFNDPRAVPVFEAILRDEDDRKLRLHAARGLL